MNENEVTYITYTNNPEENRALSIGEWIVTLLVMCIPCFNIVMLFVWGFGSKNINRKNFCKAELILCGISFIFTMIFLFIMIANGILWCE